MKEIEIDWEEVMENVFRNGHTSKFYDYIHRCFSEILFEADLNYPSSIFEILEEHKKEKYLSYNRERAIKDMAEIYDDLCRIRKKFSISDMFCFFDDLEMFELKLQFIIYNNYIEKYDCKRNMKE